MGENLRSKPLDVRSQPLDAHSKPLYVHPKALNGDCSWLPSLFPLGETNFIPL